MSVTGLIVFLAISGCVSSNTVEPGPVSGEVDEGGASSSNGATVVEFHFDQNSTYENLELEWLDLEDSRCPTGVECVWAGQMVVTLKVSRGEGESLELELLLRVGREPQPASAYGYEFRLQGVDPHPKYGVTFERSDHVARVEIK